MQIKVNFRFQSLFITILMVILSFFNEIYNFVVKYSSINKRNTKMIKALLCFIVADKSESLEIIDSLQVREQKGKF